MFMEFQGCDKNSPEETEEVLFLTPLSQNVWHGTPCVLSRRPRLKLARAHRPYSPRNSMEVSPSPSPSTLPNPVPSPSDNDLELAVKLCSDESRTCRADNFTACLQYARNERESFLFIQKSGGEITFEVNVTFLPYNVTTRETLPAAPLINKVNVTEGIQGSSSIVLNARGEECVIDTNLEGHRQLHPSHGILACLVIMIGVGAWGSYVYKFRRSRRGNIGWVRIPYKRVDARVAPSRPSCATVRAAKDVETGTVADGDGWKGKVKDWDEGKTAAACSQKKRSGSGSSPATISSRKAD